jgi:pyrimidine-nucleoside phosphorylase
MFYLGEKSGRVADGRALAESMIANGKALEKFRECIRLQGGDERVIDKPELLPAAAHATVVSSAGSGYVVATNCEEFGVALAMLGGGREKKEDRIDHAVGLEFHKRIGERVEKGEALVTIHYNSDAKVAEAKRMIAESFVIGAEAAEAKPLIRRILGA